MIVENSAFLRDPRVRREAETLSSAGHKVSVISPGEVGRPWHECINRIEVYSFPQIATGIGRWGYLLEYVYATVAIAALTFVVSAREGFDTIHIANPPDTLVLAAAAYKLFGKQIIYDQHDLCPELYKVKFARFSPALLQFLFWSERKSYTLADHVLTTNKSYWQTAISRGRVPQDKVTVVRNGPDLEFLENHGIDDQLRARSHSIFAYGGITGFQDGLDSLCRILHCLRYGLGREEFHCLIMGAGDALSEVKRLAKELRVDDKIEFTGWIDESDRYLRYLNTADICISPEPCNEYNNRSTFVKVMEYMAAGKPIVCFDLAETRVSAAESAVYVSGNDEREFAVQLSRLMDDPSRRSQMGQIGRERIRTQLAWQYSIPNLLSAYACLERKDQSGRVTKGQNVVRT
jgi:glycosyltransferase involved in cell wall biosynthesis